MNLYLSYFFFGFPLYTPLSFASSIPSLWRSFIVSLSNSARDANILNTSFPLGVVVSKFSLIEINCTSFSLSLSTKLIRSFKDLPNREISSTGTTSRKRTHKIDKF